MRKEYTYQIYNSRIRDPFYVNRAWFYPKHLDEAVMQQAAAQFVGTHDFAAVRSRRNGREDHGSARFITTTSSGTGACDFFEGLRQWLSL